MKMIESISRFFASTWWREWRFPFIVTALCILTMTAYTMAPVNPSSGGGGFFREVFRVLMPLTGAGGILWGLYAFTGCPYQRRTEAVRFAYFFMLTGFAVLALPPLLKSQAIGNEPIGMVSGCITDDKGAELLRCRKPGETAIKAPDDAAAKPSEDAAGKAPLNNQWLVNIGGTMRSQGMSKDCIDEADPECKIGSRKHRAEITGGLVVPLPFIIIALFGGAVSMSRRIPELQKRSENAYVGTDPEPKLQPAEVREMLAFQLLQFVSAPLIAIVAYEALRPDSGSTSAALAFMSGFGSETILMMVRGVVDGIKPKPAAPPVAAGATAPVPAAAAGIPLVPLRLAVGTTGLDAGTLGLTVDNAATPIGPDGLIELRLAPDRPHRIVASARRAGTPVTNQLDLTPSPGDRDKPLSITL